MSNKNLRHINAPPLSTNTFARIKETTRGCNRLTMRPFNFANFSCEICKRMSPPSWETIWSAYKAITKYISHESGRTKEPVEAARKKFESMYFDQDVDTLNKAHQAASAI